MSGIVSFLHIQIPPDQLLGYAAATAYTVAPVTVAAVYPQCTLKGIPTCSNHSGTIAIWHLHGLSKVSGCEEM